MSVPARIFCFDWNPTSYRRWKGYDMSEYSHPEAGFPPSVDSMVQYSVYRDAIDSGQEQVAKDIFAAIKDYNHFDCISTWKLRDWLLNLSR
jgi:hypothetical protein